MHTVSWTENVSNILLISVTVRHKSIQSNVPVGHIMITLCCWHSNLIKSFENIKFDQIKKLYSLPKNKFRMISK